MKAVAANNPSVITRMFNGETFVFREDGYFNMTRAAKIFGKDIKEYLKLQATAEYLEAMVELVGGNPPIKVKWGNGRSLNVGTWGHPKLAVFFARWLDARFAVFCDMAIDDILRGRAQVVATAPALPEPPPVPVDIASALEAIAAQVRANEAQAVPTLPAPPVMLTIRAFEEETCRYFSHGLKKQFTRIARKYSDSHGLPVHQGQCTYHNEFGNEPEERTPLKYTREALEYAADVLIP